MNCKRKIFYLVSLTFLVFTTACNTTEPIPVDENIKIAEIDAAVIETYLNIHISNPSQSKKVVLERNGKEVMNFTATNIDTAITDTGLTENTLYKYKARLVEGSKVIGESSEVNIRTMQPTSHDFSWQTFTFGEGSSSILYDVAIINDTLAYAVGTIYLNDKTGNPDPQPYCLAKWNGKTWSLKKLYYNDKDYQGNMFTSVLSNIRGIFAFNSTDIWLAAGSVFHWNGADSITEFSYHILTPSGLLPGINKLWGTSSSDLYGVGNLGSIIHYTNDIWQKIESGTNLNFYCLFGSAINQSNQSEILAVGSDVGIAKGSVIVKINNQNTTSISTKNITGNITTTWFIPNRAYYMGSGLLYYKHKLTDYSWQYLPSITQSAVTSIHGNDINDFFITSSRGEIVHFNGIGFMNYYDQIGTHGIVFGSIKSKGNVVIAIGFIGARAVITLAKKQP